MRERSRSRSVSRRRFIGLAAIGGASLAARPWRALSTIFETPRWSDRRTWGGTPPGPDQFVRVSRRILLDTDTQVGDLVIERGGELVFDPNKSVTVRTSRNVVVEGVLAMRPASPRIVHRLVFTNVDERAFVGGGHEPLETDVGLWVMDQGRLDLQGSKKRAWTRSAGDVSSGIRKVALKHDPTGWRVGDDVALTPTLPPTRSNFSTAFDLARIRAVNGRTVRLSSATRFAHPEGPGLGAEVLNLNRNVRIEGTPSGRSHIFIHSSRPQTVKNVAIRHMGPRQPGDAEHPTVGVMGRYGLHFHECGRSSRGSRVTGVVVRDCGNHCFVAHNSHGVTFRNCISYDTWDDPYWWDPNVPGTESRLNPENFSNGITYDRCVAALARPDPPLSGSRMAAFWLGTSTIDNSDKCVGSVAVGIQSASEASGFHWPEGNEGVWVMQDCVAHNNRVDGIFTWQNTPRLHVIDRFTAYRNGKAGIEHGAYGNVYVYRDVHLVENTQVGVLEHARSSEPGALRYERPIIEGSPVGFMEGEINPAAVDGPPVLVCEPTFRDVGVDFDDSSVSTPTFEVQQTC